MKTAEIDEDKASSTAPTPTIRNTRRGWSRATPASFRRSRRRTSLSRRRNIRAFLHSPPHRAGAASSSDHRVPVPHHAPDCKAAVEGAMGFGNVARQAADGEARGASRSKMSPASMKRKEELQEIRRLPARSAKSFSASVGAFRRARCSSVRRGTGKTLPRARHRRRSGRAVLYDLGFGLRRDVRRSASAPAASATCSSTPRRNAPCIVYQSTKSMPSARHRGAGLGGGNGRARTNAQPASRRDGRLRVERRRHHHRRHQPSGRSRSGALRPGRFDRQVVVGLPDVVGREKIPARPQCAKFRLRRMSIRVSSPVERPASRAPTSRTSSTRRRFSPHAATSAS